MKIVSQKERRSSLSSAVNCASLLEDPLYGMLREFRGILEIQLHFDVFAVGFDRLGRKKEPLGDLPSGQAVSNLFKNFEFPV